MFICERRAIQCVICTWCGEDCRLRLSCEIIYQKSKCVCLPFCIHLSLAPPTYNQALYFGHVFQPRPGINRGIQARYWGHALQLHWLVQTYTCFFCGQKKVQCKNNHWAMWNGCELRKCALAYMHYLQVKGVEDVENLMQLCSW